MRRSRRATLDVAGAVSTKNAYPAAQNKTYTTYTTYTTYENAEGSLPEAADESPAWKAILRVAGALLAG
ncbi:MAG TPA: hypothetical protein VK636_14840 [Gemmatimonadaceae bacterium]|nr:hypothetical protein [Gemmatimonadaceae bacterium]